VRVVGVDLDILVYRIGFASQSGRGDEVVPEPLENALHSVKLNLTTIMEGCNADASVGFLTGKGNYREEVATIQGYKANRKGVAKPHWYNEIREYMLEHQDAILVEGQEADDALGIFLSHPDEGEERICASIDKDLLMIPGEHYNWVKDTISFTAKDEGHRFFYNQLLTGDGTDNIPGLFKLTGQKAMPPLKKPLDGMNEPLDMWNHVFQVYCDAYDNVGMALGDRDVVCRKWLTEIGQLLYIRKEEGEMWTPPDERVKHEGEAKEARS
jgi:hypothetical protein